MRAMSPLDNELEVMFRLYINESAYTDATPKGTPAPTPGTVAITALEHRTEQQKPQLSRDVHTDGVGSDTVMDPPPHDRGLGLQAGDDQYSVSATPAGSGPSQTGILRDVGRTQAATRRSNRLKKRTAETKAGRRREAAVVKAEAAASRNRPRSLKSRKRPVKYNTENFAPFLMRDDLDRRISWVKVSVGNYVDVRMLKQDDIGQDGKWTGIVTEIRHYADPEEWKIIINWLNSSAWVEAVASQKALCIPGAGRRVRTQFRQALDELGGLPPNSLLHTDHRTWIDPESIARIYTPEEFSQAYGDRISDRARVTYLKQRGYKLVPRKP